MPCAEPAGQPAGPAPDAAAQRPPCSLALPPTPQQQQHRKRVTLAPGVSTLLSALHFAAQSEGEQGPRPAACGGGQEPCGAAAALVINRAAFCGGWREGSVQKFFTWNEDDELGQGSFGKVFRGRSVYQSSRVVAVKQIVRSGVDDADQLWAEIRILSELDHPNILRFLEAYHDAKHIYVITEVCLGGSLTAWVGRVCGDAVFAARVVHEVTGALAYCHSRSVCHRDLKLDNILLVRNAADSPSRVADFGLAKRCSQRIRTQRLNWEEARTAHERSSTRVRGTAAGSPTGYAKGQPSVVRLTSFKGTVEYMAPEVIRILDTQLKAEGRSGSKTQLFYDFRCDVWSLGVVAHLLLTGEPPYSVEDVSAYVAEGAALPEALGGARCCGERPEPAPEAEDFIRQCLRPDFMERPTAEELLGHGWLGSGARRREAASPAAAAEVFRRLRGYGGLSHFKRAALTAAVRHLGAYEHEQLRAFFQEVDLDNSGRVTPETLCAVLRAATQGASEEDLELAARVLDSDRSGEIDFTEFLAAVMDQGIEDRHDLALAAFRGFDLDGDGQLSKKELAYVFEGMAAAEEALELGDGDGDGELSFEEFLALLRRG